jgi:predicted RNA-binding Zn ribbon-like protein
VVGKPVADAIPAELLLVRDFVNTLDVEETTDELASPAAFAAWCERHGLVPPGTHVTRGELAAAIQVRDALRRALLAHSGYPIPADALAATNETIARYRATIALDPRGDARIEPHGRGTTMVLARILVDVAVAQLRGTWPRAKLCPAEDCLWAFYDHSKNRSRRWCSMDVCGNRTKTKQYRRRRRPSGSIASDR